MKFSLLYPVTVGSADRLGTGLLGLEPQLYGSAIAELREQAVAADRAGWTSLMLAEQHFEVEGYQVTPNPLLVNVYLAQHTSRLRQGQLGLAVPSWNPLRLAEDIAVADHLTGGRLDVGLSFARRSRSAGILGQHFAAHADGRALFEEWFEIMRLAWTQELWAHDGAFIQVPPPGLAWRHPVSERLGASGEDGALTRIGAVPKPLQSPHPPLYTVLTGGLRTVEWAARVGSNLVTAETEPGRIREVTESYARAATRHGRNIYLNRWEPGGGIALCRFLAVAATHEEALRTGGQAMPYIGDWLAEFGLFDDRTAAVPRTLDELVSTGAMLLGTPDGVGEQVAGLIDDYGIDHLVFVACAGAVDHDRMLETIVRFGDEVIGRLSRA
ncbi:LLM class flavin-dependent oxidoreductase [Actinomadura formosensis]|uniref:LLM class flavin-dependent oxidoreductase n=1 Tax=Actinomadura formosensis TaxID=60706 RepID=UPI00082B28CC|nr:LLM class flavin-dependent oxidoreductase [Actinomadura formosensis]